MTLPYCAEAKAPRRRISHAAAPSNPTPSKAYVLGSGINTGTGFEEKVPVPAAEKLLKKPFAPMERLGTIDENESPTSR